jgi:sugar lactone lactonase YvrE
MRLPVASREPPTDALAPNWADIPRGQLFRYDPKSERHEQCYEGRPLGGFTIQMGGSLLLFMDRGTVTIWHDGLPKEVIPEIPPERTSRFNDVIADPRGRVFCGTMSTPERKGRLYRVDPEGSCIFLLEEVGCSDGMASMLIAGVFYHTDSFEYEIHVFDYDIEIGDIQKSRFVLDLLKLMHARWIDDGRELWSVDGAPERKRNCSAASERRG